MLNIWFDTALPPLLADGFSDSAFEESMNRSILEADARIGAFSEQEGDCGTTVSGVFLCGGHYACAGFSAAVSERALIRRFPPEKPG